MEEPPSMDILFSLADRMESVIRETLGKGGADKVLFMGADGTPTLHIDMEAEEALSQAMQDNDLELNILSEETGFTDNGSHWTLVVDPVDGTYNAIRGSGPFAISMAVVQGSLSGVKLGLVRNLQTGNQYHAVKGEGAFLNCGRIHTADFQMDEYAASIYLGQMATTRCRKVAERSSKVRYMGCVAVEMCLVASGALDICMLESQDHMHDPRISDVAAAYLIVKEAGGVVFNAGGMPFDMELKADARSSIFAAGDKKAMEVIQ